jgi:hypothetical protein
MQTAAEPEQRFDKDTFRAYLVETMSLDTTKADAELFEVMLNEIVNIFPTHETIISHFEAEEPDDHDGLEIYHARSESKYLNLWYNPEIQNWVLLQYKDHTRDGSEAVLHDLDSVVTALVDYFWGD